MKFAPVCPIHIYELLAEHSKETLGDYFLLLAHDVLANAERYEAFFKDKGYTIIMDNSVIELGNACNMDTLIEAANIVGATCIAIPDVLCDGNATYRKCGSFMQEWLSPKWAGKNLELMFIPQGKDWKDYVRCLDMTLQRWGRSISWIGIPRNLTGRVIESRRSAVALTWGLAQMYALRNNYQPPKIHLLGFSDDVLDDFYTAVNFRHFLEGIDSAVPLRIGSNSKMVTSLDDMQQYASMMGPRGDWWETVDAAPGTFIVHNTSMTRKLIGEV